MALLAGATAVEAQRSNLDSNATSVLTYTSAPNTKQRRVTLRRDGDRVVLVDDSTHAVVASAPGDKTNGVVVEGLEGDHTDTLTVDLRGGLSLPRGVEFNAGVAGFDTLNIVHDPATQVRFDYEPDDARGHRGRVVVDGTVITYSGIEPLTATGTAANIVFNLPSGTVGAVLQDDGTPGNNVVQVASTNGTFEATNFIVPTNSLTVNAGGGTDTITTAANFSGDFNAALTINGTLGTDSVTLNSLTLGNGGANSGNVSVTANTITVNGTINTLFGSSRNVSLTAGGAIVDGNVNEPDVKATSLAVKASGGISLDTQVSNFAFQNIGGTVRIANTGALTITPVGALTTSSNSGTTTTLSAASTLTFAVNVTSAGTLSATTTETAFETVAPLPPPDDDITVNSGVTVESTGGDVVLNSADNVIVQNGALVRADVGNVLLTGGVGDNDNDASITVGGVTAGAAVTLTSSLGINILGSLTAGTTAILVATNGAIFGAGGIMCGNLALSATAGIGTNGSPLSTTTANLVASNTSSGGIFINNIGNLTIGFAGDPFQGVRDSGAAADAITLTNAGSILVTRNAVANEIISAPGNVTVAAFGATGNIVTGESQNNFGNPSNALKGSIVSVNAALTLTAGQDLLIGNTAGPNLLGNVLAGGNLVLNAGRNISIDDFSFVFASTFSVNPAATVTATAGGNTTLLQTQGPGATVRTSGGAITLTTGLGGTFTANSGAAAGDVQSNGGAITINADLMTLTDATSLAAGAGLVALLQVAPGRNIDVGTKSLGNLGLTSIELSHVTTSNGAGLVIGNNGATFTGGVTVSAAITGSPNYGNTLSLRAGGPFSASAPAGSLNVNNVLLTDTSAAGHTWTISPVSVIESPNAAIPYSTATNLTVNGGSGSDTFGVTPSTSTTFTINGGLPAPPSSPGDTLNVVTSGTTTPTLSVNRPASGFQGTETFGNRQPVTFAQIESGTVAPTHFAVSAPATATAGSAFSVTVTALDQLNNVASGYSGIVHFTSSDGLAVLPADSMLTNGVGTFSATLKTAGNQTLSAADLTYALGIGGTSNNIVVSAAAATHFTVSAPASATAGSAFSFTVTALDQFNNTATGYVGTVHFTSSDGVATLPANSTLTNGAGTFSATLRTAGNQTITATDSVTSSITGASNLTVSSTPTISTISPNQGPTTGGQSITISGTNLTGASSVTFGGAAAMITANTASSITVNTPTRAAGSVDVVVTTPNGTATSIGGFTYVTCGYSVSPSSISAPSGGMSGTFNVITSIGCPWSAMSDAAWLTTSSTGTGNGSVSYTVAANTSTQGRSGTITVGGQGFTVTQSGVLPSNLIATATSTTSVSLSWNSTSVDHFEVWRNSGSGFVLLSSPMTTSYTDNAVSANAAYVYKVRAVDSNSIASVFTNFALATTMLFTDDPLVPGVTVIKAIHVSELRQAVSIVRAAAGLGAYSFTDPSLVGITIRVVHVLELRNALDPARSNLGLAPLTYTTISVGGVVGAVEFTELRNGVK